MSVVYENNYIDDFEVRQELERLVDEKLSQPLNWIELADVINESSCSIGTEILNAYNEDEALVFYDSVKRSAKEYYTHLYRDTAVNNVRTKQNERMYA